MRNRRFLATILCLMPMVLASPLFNGCKASTDSLPPGVLAYADGAPVTIEEFKGFLDIKGISIDRASGMGREELLKEFIVDLQLAKDSRSRGFDESAQIRAVSTYFERQELPGLFFQKEFLEKTVIDDKDFEPLYIGLTDQADISVAVLGSEEECGKFLEQLKKNEPFEALVAKYSLGNSAQKAGVIFDVIPADVRFTLEEKNAVFSSKNGKVLGPFQNKLGAYSVIKVLDVRTVEDRKEAIRKEKAKEVKETKAVKAYLSRLNEEFIATEIEINDEFFDEQKADTPRKQYLAWVKGQYIFPHELGIDAAKESHSRKSYRRSLDKVIQSVIAADLAKKAGIAEMPEYKSKRKALLDSQLVQMLIESEFQKANLTATEKEIEHYYRENYKPEVYSIWVVINEDPTKVDAARKDLLGGEDSSRVAAKYSDDPSRLKGGVIGYLPITSYDSGTVAAIRGLQKGEVSKPYLVNGKYAIARLVDQESVPIPPLSEVKDKIRHNVILQKRSRMVKERRAKVLEELALTIDYDKLGNMK